MRVFAWPGAGRPPALRQRGAISLLLAAAVMGGSNQATHRRERQSPGLGSIDPYNKARSMGPGHLPAQPWCLPKGVGRSCAFGFGLETA